MKYKILNDIIDSEIGDSFYLLNINTGKYLKLNTSGMYIFNLLKETNDSDFIIYRIIQEFNLTKDQAKEDFYLFTSLATKLGIIKTLDD
jgi:hypothetical protein